MNEEILKKLGYNNIALEMLLKREAQIDHRNIIMPGEERSNIQQDYSNVEIILENLKSQTTAAKTRLVKTQSKVNRVINLSELEKC